MTKCPACEFKDRTNAALQARIFGEAPLLASRDRWQRIAEELDADGARLAWLADAGAATAFGTYVAQCIRPEPYGSFCEYHTPPRVGADQARVHSSRLDALRAAIDAAMAGDAPEARAEGQSPAGRNADHNEGTP